VSRHPLVQEPWRRDTPIRLPDVSNPLDALIHRLRAQQESREALEPPRCTALAYVAEPARAAILSRRPLPSPLRPCMLQLKATDTAA
jgi:hypothetical protein